MLVVSRDEKGQESPFHTDLLPPKGTSPWKAGFGHSSATHMFLGKHRQVSCFSESWHETVCTHKLVGALALCHFGAPGVSWVIWTRNSQLRGQKENAAEPQVKGNTKGTHRACWGPRFLQSVHRIAEGPGQSLTNSHIPIITCISHQSVQSLSCVWLFATPWTAAHHASLSITNSKSLLKLMSIKSVMPSNHLILCHPLLFPPSIFPSISIFSNESVLHIRCPEYWSFSFSISPFNEYSGLISSRMDWLDLLAVQGTLKSLLQHHSLKASILWHSGFFIVQLSHPYMTTGKTIALTKWTFVGNVISLLFNMVSRLVITFLPRSKHLLISWLQSPSALILETKKRKIYDCFRSFPIYLPWSDGTEAMIFIFECWVLSQLFHSPLSPSSRGSWVPLHFLLLGWCHLHIWGYSYFSTILIPACESSSLTFCRMHTAYELNKQGDNYSLAVLLSNLELVHCSMSSSNCFLIGVQISQQTVKVV